MRAGGESSTSLTARPQRQRPPARHRVIAERRRPEPSHVAAALQPARGAAPLHREQPGGDRRGPGGRDGDGAGAGGTRGCRHLAMGRAEGGRAWLWGGPGCVLRCP